MGDLLSFLGINVQTIKKMKKVFSIVAVALVAASFVACGPSAEEKAKMEEREKFMKDSMAAAISTDMAAPATDSAAAATEAPAAETATPAAEQHAH